MVLYFCYYARSATVDRNLNTPVCFCCCLLIIYFLEISSALKRFTATRSPAHVLDVCGASDSALPSLPSVLSIITRRKQMRRRLKQTAPAAIYVLLGFRRFVLTSSLSHFSTKKNRTNVDGCLVVSVCLFVCLPVYLLCLIENRLRGLRAEIPQ